MHEQEIYERVSIVEQSVKSAHRRIDEVAKNNKSIAEILVEMKYMRRDLNKLIERVTSVEARPARRYDYMINAFISAAVAALINFLI